MPHSPRKLYWSDLTTTEFGGLDGERTLAVLPVAAFEQHGPHLSVATDTIIAEGMLKETIARLSDDLPVLILPTQAIGKSNEHIRSPGTLTLSAQTALRAWTEIGESVARAGLRKLVIVNAHGGNTELIGIVARELRVRCQMLCVHTAWRRFGLPPELYSAEEDMHGIHAGDIETSLMLHFRPDLVRMENAQNFISSAAEIAREYTWLRPIGLHAFGWIAPDLHAAGAVGDASRASAEKGRVTAAYQAERFIELLRDVSRFPLARLT
ncbi:MAG: creatininase family protein [Methylobacteriaceae bacterium]|nr:creatininase family protein [Methylobacteriaceae bacterium]